MYEKITEQVILNKKLEVKHKEDTNTWLAVLLWSRVFVFGKYFQTADVTAGIF